MRQSLKWERPHWIDKIHENKIEWQLFDAERDRLKFCKCKDQKEAIKKAISYGIVPRSTNHVTPRSGGYRTEIMTEREFQRFMDRIRN